MSYEKIEILDLGFKEDSSPEKSLFASVLLRAYTDLDLTIGTAHHDVIEAIGWFKNYGSTSKDWKRRSYVTFDDCVDVLDLSDTAVKFFLKAALKTDKLLVRRVTVEKSSRNRSRLSYRYPLTPFPSR